MSSGRGRRVRPRHLALVPILYLVIGAGGFVQIPGWNETSQYALVRALHSGTAQIDPYASQTGDRGYYKGHSYSNKAPGLAFFTTPFYSATRAVGIDSKDPATEIHWLAVFGCLLPFAVLLWLIADFTDRIQPGSGAATAMLLGLGTLLLPFSTMFFSHVLSACLGFAAYYLLWLERRAGGHRLAVPAAGVLAGFAVATEYPQALLAGVLAAYALGRPVSIRRLVRFGAGGLLGVAPLLAYNWWAFGSPLRDSYAIHSIAPPLAYTPLSLHGALDVLFGPRGLLSLTPVMAAAAGGVFVLYRRGRRSEAVMAGTVAIVFVAFNASLNGPVGGWTPGPRYLIDAIPFLALPLAASLDAAPLLTLALGAVSAATMFVASVTVPELPNNLSTSVWWHDLVHGVFPFPDGSGRVVWFGVLAAVAAVITAVLAPRPRFNRAQLQVAVLGVAAWLIVASFGGSLIHSHAIAGELALIAIVAAAYFVVRRAAVQPNWLSVNRPLRVDRAG